VFLVFLVGNDFMPHVPSFDIKEGILDVCVLRFLRFFFF
jgi:5'-3' exonuclease